MAWTWKIITILFVSITTGIEGARILAYFPTPSISHQVVFRYVTEELARRGHEVIVITTDPLPEGRAPANLTEVDVHDVSYSHWQELLFIHTGKKQDALAQFRLLLKKLATIIYVQMKTPQVRNILRDKHKKYFDLLLLEAMNRPLTGIVHLFDAPIVQISSLGAVPQQYNDFGAPMHPLLYPSVITQRSYNLNLWEKAVEMVKYFVMECMISNALDFEYRVMKKTFGDDIPSIEELWKNIQMLLLNEHPIWSENHPVPSNIAFIGGIHQSVEKDLPQDLKYYLDSSKHGVIYVSFGTNVLPSLLPRRKIRIMSKVFSQLPYDVLWKWDNGLLPGQSNNTKTSHWFPQSDLLKHPNVKLFITQGGLQSTDETINAAVPVIGIPMLGDQWYNVEKYVHYKIGLQLDITSLTEKGFKDAVVTVIENKSYKDNIVRLRSLMREFPVKPLDKAVWWIEHIIQYGGSHLRSPASGLSWMQYYEINLVLVALVLLVIVMVILGYVLKLVFSFAYTAYTVERKLKKF